MGCRERIGSVRRSGAAFALLAALAACGTTLFGCGTATVEPYGDGSGGPGRCTGKCDGAGGPAAWLELHARDIWAQPLPADGAELVVLRDGRRIAASGFPVARVALDEAGAYDVQLTAPDHEPLQVRVHFDGTDSPGGATLDGLAAAGRHGLSFGHGRRMVEGREAPVHTLFLGLRHRWFSAQGRPARRGNQVLLLQDGEEAWAAAHADLASASGEVKLSTWWWESDFELVRDPARHAELGAAERRANTILGLLEASFAEKRVLVGQFQGQDGGPFSGMSIDEPLQHWAEQPDDGFEVLAQGNGTNGSFWFEVPPFRFGDRLRADPAATALALEPEPELRSDVPSRQIDLTAWGFTFDVASYHQKFLVVDDRVAYVGGMNLRRTDWDTSEHLVFEPRRVGFSTTGWTRRAIAERQAFPDTNPRKDYQVRLEGPAVQDVAEIFQERWNRVIEDGASFAATASGARPGAPAEAIPGGAQVQVTATLPAPFHEHAIAESWLAAVRAAGKFVFIEDQYFRMPMINDALAARMDEVPSLRLVVITKPVNEWTDPGCAWTHLSHQLFRTRFPERYLTLQLRSFATAPPAAERWPADTAGWFVDMDVHSKLLIVDDRFLSVGSANKNNRALVYEGELNVAVLDDAFVGAARRRILANVLPPGVEPADHVEGFWAQLVEAAAWNDAVRARWDGLAGETTLGAAPLPDELTPRGFVYSLDFDDPKDCLIGGVGPDLT